MKGDVSFEKLEEKLVSFSILKSLLFELLRYLATSFTLRAGHGSMACVYGTAGKALGTAGSNQKHCLQGPSDSAYGMDSKQNVYLKSACEWILALFNIKLHACKPTGKLSNCI